MPADRKAKHEDSRPFDPEGRVVPFRPRERALRPAGPPKQKKITRQGWPEPWEDYYGDESEEHPRRTLLNVIGVVCTLLLIAAGLWLAHALVDMRNIQDCVLSGRTNCAPIAVRSVRP